MTAKKTATMLLGALLTAGTLSACQEKTQTTTETTTETKAAEGEKTGTTTESSTDTTTETTTETAETADTAAKDDAAGTDATAADDQAASQPEVTTPGELPSGYTEVAALSQEPKREFSKAPERSLQPNTDYYALFDTSRGQILVDLYEADTPVTVNNFVYLARNHFYDGTRFHRVIDGFMAQGGDPQSADEAKKDAWGTGGPGYQFGDEIRQKLTFSEPGLLAMANAGPGTNGSQFFLTLGPTDFLNGRHTIFGKIVSGQETVDALTRTATSDPTSGQEVPVEGAAPDKVLSVRILSKS